MYVLYTEGGLTHDDEVHESLSHPHDPCLPMEQSAFKGQCDKLRSRRGLFLGLPRPNPITTPLSRKNSSPGPLVDQSESQSSLTHIGACLQHVSITIIAFPLSGHEDHPSMMPDPCRGRSETYSSGGKSMNKP